MYAAYSQNVSGGLVNPLNSRAFQDANNGGTFSSQKFLYNGKKTEPITNQFETQKVVYGSRDTTLQVSVICSKITQLNRYLSLGCSFIESNFIHYFWRHSRYRLAPGAARLLPCA